MATVASVSFTATATFLVHVIYDVLGHLGSVILIVRAMASGLAGKIRRVTESDEFDLSGYDQVRCNELAKAAFDEPLALKEMVRISFVVGGGKLVRQKYSDDLPKHFCSALTLVGFQEDNSATVEQGSAGKFKYHHDTNKNLKFVHVFPKISEAAPARAAEEGEAAEAAEATPEEMLLRSDDADFLRLVQAQVVTYAEKKRLLDLLKQRISDLEAIEAKMTRLERLEPSEEALFNDVGAEELKEKRKVVEGEMKAMVDSGRLTAAERTDLLEQLEGKLEAVNAEIAKAQQDGKAKKVQALQHQLELMQSTKASVKAAEPVALPPLKHGAKIRELRMKLAELAQVEKVSKGHYSMDELKRLGERPEIEEAVEELEKRARGWLESDEVFQERLQANLRTGLKKGTGRGGGSGGYTAVSSGVRPAKAKASGPAVRNGFSALA
ncbi:hypothetical protein AK812_SmicGene24584 [Symbiodinium microadriaticum]|uniref:Uncharacterized protein n=1 Tax=Symbiodinium microadriaticum TaxID=2951 RepID=A0A1Q9DE88_SYMMI|nr:hypothetical protein AK812_SmicGene24584 [Symbiodinium microadriaticum]